MSDPAYSRDPTAAPTTALRASNVTVTHMDGKLRFVMSGIASQARYAPYSVPVNYCVGFGSPTPVINEPHDLVALAFGGRQADCRKSGSEPKAHTIAEA